MYEFLPAFGTILAAIMGARNLVKTNKARKAELESEPFVTETTIVEELPEPELEPEKEKSTTIVNNEGEVRRPPVLILLLYWSVMSLVAFSFAGERMPWLATHITMPMILASGWAFGRLLEGFEWSAFKKNRGWITLIVGVLFLITAAQTFGSLFSAMPPFQGKDLAQIEATTNFIVASWDDRFRRWPGFSPPELEVQTNRETDPDPLHCHIIRYHHPHGLPGEFHPV